MTRKALFVYTTEHGTGLSLKAARIEAGLQAAGLSVRAIYFRPKGSAMGRLWHLIATIATVTYLATTRSYDVVLIRYAYYFLPLYPLLSAAQRRVRIELNGDPQAELAAKGRKLRAFLDRLALKAALSSRARIHVVSRTLAGQYKKAFPDAQITFTPNFVCEEYYTPRTAPLTGSAPTQLLFLGNPSQSWHGVSDFISVVASQSWFRRACQLNIVGTASREIDDLVATLGLANVVVQHGFLSGIAKHRLAATMHIGISGFALHRKGLTETTAIKTGEYLYSGLPIILGYHDSALVPGLPFVLNVNLSELPAPSTEIEAFVSAVRSTASLSHAAHDYARQHLTVERYIHAITTH